jgi:RHS repeat-associated protein
VYIFSGSKVVAEYDNGAAPTAPSREYVYGGSALLAKIDSSGTKYYHQDHLSNRLVTSSTGNTLAQMGHFPFGESWYNSTSDKLLFTTYERDAESGNDYAQARYYANRLARYSSLDPLSGSTSMPQSLNRFPYVNADPINATDPLGLMKCFAKCPGWGAQLGGGGDGFDQIIMGYTLWDALVGTPGTYYSVDQYTGNLTFGFSIDKWQSYYASQSSTSYKIVGVANPSVEEQQKQLAAIQLGQQKCSGQDSSAVASCIQQAYDTMGDAVGLQGGKYIFSYASVQIDGQSIVPGDLGCSSIGDQTRCDAFDSLHFHTDTQTFHVDTGSAWSVPIGSLTHLFFDVLGGNTWWSAGIPRPWWQH